MKFTVLVDNNTISGLKGEWGASYLIEDGDTKILLDTGWSDLFIKNAKGLNKDLSQLDYVVISHGHNDHFEGIYELIKLLRQKGINKEKAPTLVTHPLTVEPKFGKENMEIGAILSESGLSRSFNLNLSKKPVWITENLVFLGEIKRENDFENKNPIGQIIVDGKYEDDYIKDDSALAYKTEDGIIIITGCSHSGICNIIEQAKEVCNDDRIIDIIGGMHLLNPSKEQIDGTIEYLKRNTPKSIHPCHCTDLKSKIAMSRVSDVKEVGVGLRLEF